MRNLDLDELQIFKAVAEAGGMTRAAKQLGRVPSNVSTRLKQLEAQLGRTLFERHNGKLVLSNEGRLLLTYADRLLSLAAEAGAVVRSGIPCGVFRVGSLESTAASRLPPILAGYHKTYPDVDVELATGTTAALVSRVLSGDLEAAFVAEPFAPGDLEMQHAFNEHLVLITPRDIRHVKSPRDLDRSTIIAFAVGCAYRRRLDEWLGRAGLIPGRFMEFGSYHAILACVAAGSGIAIVPRSVVRLLHAESEVSVHPLPVQVANAKTQLVWRTGHHSLALEALRREVPKPRH
jgi:DNA-binding transcriptional LysR family regulator